MYICGNLNLKIMNSTKEKALELVEKFTYWNTREAEREGIKSALLLVDEMINEFDSLEHYRIDYWYEVKEEILNL